MGWIPAYLKPRPTLYRLIKRRSHKLVERSLTTGVPPTETELQEINALQSLRELEEKTRYQLDHWFILAGSILIAIGVGFFAFRPYPLVRLYVTAKAKEVNLNVRYQDVHQRVDLVELRLNDIALTVDQEFDSVRGDYVITGPTLKPDTYTGLTEGPLSVKYSDQERKHIISMRGPRKGTVIPIIAPGATIRRTDNRSAEPRKVQQRILIDGQNDNLNGEIIAVVKPVDKSSTVFVLGEETISNLHFVNMIRFDDKWGIIFSPGSTIIAGRIDFLNVPGKSYSLKPTQELITDEIVGSSRLRSLDLLPDAVQITYNTGVTDVRVGEFESPASITPTYLEYFQSRKGLAAVYATIGSLISILIGITGFLLRRASSS